MLLELTPAYVGGIIGAIATAAVGAVPVYIALMRARHEVKTARQKDAISEWQTIADRLQTEITDMRLGSSLTEQRYQRELESIRTSNVNMQAQVMESIRSEGKCRERVAELEGEIRLLSANQRRLQERSGDTPPATTLPTQIICDGSGRILSVTPSVGAMFHWLPAQLLRQNIELLIPEELRERHRAGLARLVMENRNPDPERPILSYGLTKDGTRFPIAIHLSGWDDSEGHKFMTAEIRRRADAESGIIAATDVQRP